MNVTVAIKGCTEQDVVILLAHQPSAAKRALDDERNSKIIDLVLAGMHILSLLFQDENTQLL
jgi:hypothetical protein